MEDEVYTDIEEKLGTFTMDDVLDVTVETMEYEPSAEDEDEPIDELSDEPAMIADNEDEE